jgi:hypothetical protein
VTLAQAEFVLWLSGLGIDVEALLGPDVWLLALAVVLAERAPA